MFGNLRLIEYDLFAVFLPFVGIRFIKYLRLIPSWGPMVLAVVLTLQNMDVILYLCVMICAMSLFAIAYTVLNATTNIQYATFFSSFYSLFRASFNGEWIRVASTNNLIGYLWFFLFVIVNLILVNSLIGIVTAVLLFINLVISNC